MNKLRRIFLHNWKVKLICLLLATALWWILRYYVVGVSTTLSPLQPPVHQKPMEN